MATQSSAALDREPGHDRVANLDDVVGVAPSDAIMWLDLII
jgi:hypothetical protein